MAVFSLLERLDFSGKKLPADDPRGQRHGTQRARFEENLLWRGVREKSCGAWRGRGEIGEDNRRVGEKRNIIILFEEELL